MGWKKYPGWPGTMCRIPLSWPSFTWSTLTKLLPEAMANPSSGATLGGGGTVRESPQSPQSPPTTLTRSKSPEFWSPPPVSTNQQHYIIGVLPHTHCLVSNITCLTYLTLTFVYLPAIISTIRSSFSTVPTLHRYPALSLPWTPWKKAHFWPTPKGKRTLTHR